VHAAKDYPVEPRAVCGGDYVGAFSEVVFDFDIIHDGLVELLELLVGHVQLFQSWNENIDRVRLVVACHLVEL
jgi:hypothetical protein